jgi:hypothetical protein
LGAAPFVVEVASPDVSDALSSSSPPQAATAIAATASTANPRSQRCCFMIPPVW